MRIVDENALVGLHGVVKAFAEAKGDAVQRRAIGRDEILLDARALDAVPRRHAGQDLRIGDLGGALDRAAAALGGRAQRAIQPLGAQGFRLRRLRQFRQGLRVEAGAEHCLGEPLRHRALRGGFRAACRRRDCIGSDLQIVFIRYSAKPILLFTELMMNAKKTMITMLVMDLHPSKHKSRKSETEIIF